MLVSLTSTTPDATDLGYLLHKHPDRVRSVDVGFGRAHVFYPQAAPRRCTATLFVEVDAFAASGRRRGKPSFGLGGLEPYVNDRPYAASSMLSVAIGRLFRTALAGNCETRPELVDRPLDLEVALPVLGVRGGPELLRQLFEPLGYSVECEAIALDTHFKAWGDSRYLSVRLAGCHTLRRTLEHLYVMIPVLDDRKHYWIGPEEVNKLLRRGDQWLARHPHSDLIATRYLRFGTLTREALARLAETGEDFDTVDLRHDEAEQAAERRINLGDLRISAVIDAVRAAGGGRVADLGCGEGRLLQRLLTEPAVTQIVGMDTSVRALERAQKRLNLNEMSERQLERISLLQGSLTYTDERLRGFDVATLVEVVEHLDPERLDRFADVVFQHAAPRTVVLTTPNREHNVNFSHLGPTCLRHGDHRFEWTRQEFTEWATSIKTQYSYSFEISGIGPDDPACGPPTQMAIFRRAA